MLHIQVDLNIAFFISVLINFLIVRLKIAYFGLFCIKNFNTLNYIFHVNLMSFQAIFSILSTSTMFI